VFDSPLALCYQCKEYVALDQTRLECAAYQNCQVPVTECPLRRYFTGAYGAIPTGSISEQVERLRQVLELPPDADPGG
jgi:hypothetical protein